MRPSPVSAGLLGGVLIAIGGTAAAQQYEWRPISGSIPAGTTTLAFDAARSRGVLVLRDQTWEYDGASWFRMPVTQRPGLRDGIGLTYDPVQARTLLFGGTKISSPGAGLQNDLWGYDGVSWFQIAASTPPPPRWNSPIACDLQRQRVVLYGGESSLGFLNDTWEFDGAGWQQPTPAVTPTAHIRHALAYDAARGVTVLFGGAPVSGTGSLDETWAWNGATWTQQTPITRPPARTWSGLTYDPARQRLVLVGGRDNQTYFDDTWVWDGTDWSLVATGGTAPASDPPQSLCYDPGRDEVVNVVSQAGGPRTFVFDGSRWSVPARMRMPGARDEHSLVYDPVRDVAVMCGGGVLGAIVFRDTWEWRGGRWTEVVTATPPPAASRPGVAADPTGAGVLLFGGNSFGTPFLWRFDGVDWTRLQPSPSPPMRMAPAMTTDSGRGRVVLFGGIAGFTALADTWEWDGSSWSNRNPPTAPSPRACAAMGYDPSTQRSVLFGGADYLYGPTKADHWEWDGATWQLVAASGAPGLRAEAGLVFDPDVGRMVLIGGWDVFVPGIPLPHSDVFEWNGTAWVTRPVLGQPVARKRIAVCHVPSLHRLLMHGGDFLDDTLVHGLVSTAAVAKTGTGCPGTFGVPRLVANGLPVQSNRWFELELSSLTARGLAAIGYSVLPANVPLGGGCTALVDRPLLAFGFADDRGAFHLDLPIPNTAAVRGLTLHAQGLSLDPGGALSGLLALSQGLRIDLDR